MSEVEYNSWNAYVPPPAAPKPPSIDNTQFIKNAYNQYLGRQPSPQEISKQIQEGTARGETQEQWLKRNTAGAKPIQGKPPANFTPTQFTPEMVSQAHAAYNTYKANPYFAGGGDREAYGDPHAGDAWANFQTQISQNVRALQGVRPDVGYLPGFGAIDLQSYTPFDWQDNSKRRGGGLTDVERSLTNFFSARPDIQTPRFQDVRGKFTPSGRGYGYRGAPSAREQQLVNAGVINPRTMAEYAALVKPRIGQNKPSAMQQFANKYYGPAIMAAPAMIATAGGASPFVVGALGAMSAGAQSKFKDPAAIAIGGAGGALGGWGGGAAGQALGAGAIGTGALASAGGSLGAGVPMQAYRGQFDPAALARNAAIAGAVGGATAGLGQLGKSGYVNTPGEPGGGFKTPPTVNPAILKATMPYVKQGIGTTLDYYLPGRNEPPNPYAERQRAEEEARRRRLALTQQRQPPRRR